MQGALLPAAHLIAAAHGARQCQELRNQALKGHFFTCVGSHTVTGRAQLWFQHLEINIQWAPAALSSRLKILGLRLSSLWSSLSSHSKRRWKHCQHNPALSKVAWLRLEMLCQIILIETGLKVAVPVSLRGLLMPWQKQSCSLQRNGLEKELGRQQLSSGLAGSSDPGMRGHCHPSCDTAGRGCTSVTLLEIQE